MRIGVLSDTHAPGGLDDLGPEIAAFLATVDLVLHTGDVDDPRLLDWLEQFAPVRVARGNHDFFEDARVDDLVLVEAAGWVIGAKHQMPEPLRAPGSGQRIRRDAFGDRQVDIVIAGDTHFERVEYVEGMLFLNSGSATLPHNYSARLGGVALLEIDGDGVHAELVRLGESAGLPNPTRTGHVAFGRAGVIAASVDGAAVNPAGGEVRWPTAIPDGA